MGLTDQQARPNSDAKSSGRFQSADTRPGAPKGSALGKMPPSKT
jgi:hypothetical protein